MTGKRLGTIEQELAACRAAFAAVPGSGDVDAPCALIHHNRLFEFLSEPVESRIGYILHEKPKHERARRLRELRPWPGPLHRPRPPTPPRSRRVELVAAWKKAYAAWWKAYAKHLPALTAQHRAAFPDSAWNGETIFP